MTDKIDQVLARLEMLEEDQRKSRKAIDHGIDLFIDRFVQMDKRFDQMDRRFDQVDKTLTFQKEQRNNDVLSLLEEMNTQVSNLTSEMKQVRKTQEEQHHIIELLATRSIEQEARIKRIP